jgi:hypothetical protein
MFLNAVQIGIAAPPTRRHASDSVATVNEMGQGSILGLQQSLTDLINKQD